jgi:hypothetical protein
MIVGDGAVVSESNAVAPEAAEVWPSLLARVGARLTGLDLRRLVARCARGLWLRVPWIVAGLAAAIPVMSSTVKAARAGWVPAGDDGIIATRAWDVFTSHTPLVGQYSEAGLVVHGQLMHSPGPMLYWLLALPARFGSVTSLAVTMGVVNTLAIIGCVALAHRRGGLILMFATAVGIALMCQSLPTEAMHDIWNPAAGLFPFLLLVFLGWSLACGDYRLLPVTVLVASFVTQTHLMYAAPTAVLLVVGFGGLLIGLLERRRARSARDKPLHPPPRVWLWAVAALVVAAACWTAPAIDQIENSPGNLAMIVRTVEHRGPTLGATVGRNAVVRSVGVRPWWLYVPASEWERKIDVRATPSAVATDSTIAILIALVLAGLVGAFMLRWDLAAATLIGLGMCAAIGLEAASNPSAPLLAGTLGYTMWWGSELGFWVWLTLAWALWLGLVGLSRPVLQLLRRRLRARGLALPSRKRIAAAVVASLAGVVGVAAIGSAVAATAKRDSHAYEYRSVRRAAAKIVRLIAPGETIRIYTGGLGIGTQPMEAPIRFFLVRHGVRVLANGSLPRLGSYYELYNRPVQWTVYLVDGIRPQRHRTLAARVHFTSPWRKETVSAWVRKTTTRPAKGARAPHDATKRPRGGRAAGPTVQRRERHAGTPA